MFPLSYSSRDCFAARTDRGAQIERGRSSCCFTHESVCERSPWLSRVSVSNGLALFIRFRTSSARSAALKISSSSVAPSRLRTANHQVLHDQFSRPSHACEFRPGVFSPFSGSARSPRGARGRLQSGTECGLRGPSEECSGCRPRLHGDRCALREPRCANCSTPAESEEECSRRGRLLLGPAFLRTWTGSLRGELRV